MKKLKIAVVLICFIQVFLNQNTYSMPNPWVNCNDDIYCAARQAGFNLPLRVQNYTVRAMKDMIEITFPLDKKRSVTVRKSQLYEGKADKNGME